VLPSGKIKRTNMFIVNLTEETATIINPDKISEDNGLP
jgi:hypothetical protein